MARTTPLAFLAFVVAAGVVSACAGDAWLEESNPSGNSFFDPRLAREIHSFWYVPEPHIEEAAQLLRTQAMIALSPERAAPFIGVVPDVPPGEFLYLIRAIDVADPRPIRVYQIGAWVQVSAGTPSTCFASRPSVRRQPIVVVFPQKPTRLRLGYSCDGNTY